MLPSERFQHKDFITQCFAVLILFCLLLSPAKAEQTRVMPSSGEGWVKASTKRDASVWTREVAGTSVKEVKLEAVIDAPVEQVWRTVSQVEHYTQFMPYVDEITVFDDKGSDNQYVYHRVNPPIVSQRDYTLLIANEVNSEQGHYYRYWTQKNEFGPAPIDGVVRLTICDGSWELTATEDGGTRVTYWLYTDPGGSIPSWLANKANRSGLYDIVFAIEKRAQDKSWQ
ncbi:START domain-containing protein [Shewanella sp. UCD-KL12]|uniref:START domain-containing protein n=1 Tax=Shewanella sp. UCD-KL12 TaxID=1917163 RepID=UPI0021171CDB|nr:START domain-containing protein [Shewanella sp. UCD-KL12]